MTGGNAVVVSINKVQPSAYNPRKADPRRLELLALSLRKLGFVLPMFADADGELLSGHQRHHVATLLGCKNVPVVFTKKRSLEERKAINVAFNRGTNDLKPADTSASLTAALTAVPLVELAAQVPDKVLDSPDFMRCLTPRMISVTDMAAANVGRWVDYAKQMASSLANAGIEMPIVATPDLKVVNGIGRLQMWAERGLKAVPVVVISEAEAKLADALLNRLTMDYDIHTRYEDLLRYNSFRRARRVRDLLGRGFVFGLEGKNKLTHFDVTKPANAMMWRKHFGSTVVDFGAGHLHETDILRSIGVKVAAFEPFRLGGNNEIDKPASIALARDFLRTVASREQFSSVFISSVLNSVPFAADRQHIVRICAALCGPSSRLYAVASGVQQNGYRKINGADFLNKSDRSSLLFSLDYEPGISLGDFTGKPKVQKYHTPQEFYALFKGGFQTVQVSHASNNVQAIAAQPLPIDKAALSDSLRFEFDLPYPDGARMGLAEEAIAAFSQRLGVDL